MEGIWHYADRGHLCIGHLTSRGVRMCVELALHRESPLRRGSSNQFQDHCVAGEGFAAPVLADPGEETMLDLVPLARSWW